MKPPSDRRIRLFGSSLRIVQARPYLSSQSWGIDMHHARNPGRSPVSLLVSSVSMYVLTVHPYTLSYIHFVHVLVVRMYANSSFAFCKRILLWGKASYNDIVLYGYIQH